MWDGSPEGLVDIFQHSVLQLAILVLPILTIFLAVGVASNILQIGFVFSGEPVIPKLSKLNPITGFKNKFMSAKSLEQLLKTLVTQIS